MTEIRESWREVANKAEALGLKLRLHLEQEESRRSAGEEGSEPEMTPEPGAEPGGEPSGAGTRAAVDELFDKLKDAFDSFGSAAKDPAVRADVGEIGSLLRNALTATFSSVGADVGDAMRDMGEAVKRTSTSAEGVDVSDTNGTSGMAPPSPGLQAPAPSDEPGVGEDPASDTQH